MCVERCAEQGAARAGAEALLPKPPSPPPPSPHFESMDNTLRGALFGGTVGANEQAPANELHAPALQARVQSTVTYRSTGCDTAGALLLKPPSLAPLPSHFESMDNTLRGALFGGTVEANGQAPANGLHAPALQARV